MRIIGGQMRGRKLYSPPGQDTRPTSDMVREAVFNILGGAVVGADVLDLFAGSGALALEALSRGASGAVLVDKDFKAAGAIDRNIAAAKCADIATVVRSDWRRALLKITGRRFDLIFLDPPYAMLEVYAQALDELYKNLNISDSTIVVYEFAKGPPPELPEIFETYDLRTYGGTAVGFARKKEVV